METMIYRVDIDFIDHEESKKFSNKKAAFSFARSFDWEANVYKDFGERDGWQKIGNKPRYNKRVNTIAF